MLGCTTHLKHDCWRHFEKPNRTVYKLLFTHGVGVGVRAVADGVGVRVRAGVGVGVGVGAGVGVGTECCWPWIPTSLAWFTPGGGSGGGGGGGDGGGVGSVLVPLQPTGLGAVESVLVRTAMVSVLPADTPNGVVAVSMAVAPPPGASVLMAPAAASVTAAACVTAVSVCLSVWSSPTSVVNATCLWVLQCVVFCPTVYLPPHGHATFVACRSLRAFGYSASVPTAACAAACAAPDTTSEDSSAGALLAVSSQKCISLHICSSARYLYPTKKTTPGN